MSAKIFLVNTCLGRVSLRAKWIISLLLHRHASDEGCGLGLILAPLLGVLVLNVVQDVHPLGTITVRPLGKGEDIELVSRVSIAHASG